MTRYSRVRKKVVMYNNSIRTRHTGANSVRYTVRIGKMCCVSLSIGVIREIFGSVMHSCRVQGVSDQHDQHDWSDEWLPWGLAYDQVRCVFFICLLLCTGKALSENYNVFNNTNIRWHNKLGSFYKIKNWEIILTR